MRDVDDSEIEEEALCRHGYQESDLMYLKVAACEVMLDKSNALELLDYSTPLRGGGMLMVMLDERIGKVFEALEALVPLGFRLAPRVLPEFVARARTLAREFIFTKTVLSGVCAMATTCQALREHALPMPTHSASQTVDILSSGGLVTPPELLTQLRTLVDSQRGMMVNEVADSDAQSAASAPAAAPSTGSPVSANGEVRAHRVRVRAGATGAAAAPAKTAAAEQPPELSGGSAVPPPADVAGVAASGDPDARRASAGRKRR